MPGAFVDTNILVYAADERVPSARKTVIARELLRLPDLHISVQVLNEFTANARHPAKLNFTLLQEHDWTSCWLLFPVAPLTVDTFLAANLVHARYRISHWDSLILASAKESDCSLVYSEDLGHAREYDGVTVLNPFL